MKLVFITLVNVSSILLKYLVEFFRLRSYIFRSHFNIVLYCNMMSFSHFLFVHIIGFYWLDVNVLVFVRGIKS
jgi:hypothetical protein